MAGEEEDPFADLNPAVSTAAAATAGPG